MKFEKCRNCKYVCTCCYSRINNDNCSGCEFPKDEFKPAPNIKYCPLDGKELEDTED